MAETVRMDISSASILRGILLVILFIFLYILKDVIIIFLFALVLASAISPFANWLDQKRFPRVVGVLGLYVLVLGLGIFILSLVIPYVSDDISHLTSSIPTVVERVTDTLENAQNSSPQYLDFLGEIQNILSGLSGWLQQA